ncbi:WbqC family protein [Ekhidna sp.]|uniref:WbqC family protein n=1 Tax=Ekhidna sp. TaxID=2608089 RepID=UPI003B512F91
MSKLIIEPHYLGSLEYYALLLQYDKVELEVCDVFQKQTFRNRAYFLTSNKVQPLIVPLRYSTGCQTKDVTIDYSQRWVKDHWGAFYSGYGKAPFFEYFADDFKAIWDVRFESLCELNLAFMKLTFKILQSDLLLTSTEKYDKNADVDFRDIINPKKPFSDRKIYHSNAYQQLFGDTFVPNLSIIDLIMNEGPNAAHILMSSYNDEID